ncbi:Dolichyl-diphosphooligosaccharide--protein glycosyltransferase subunit OST2 [Apiospora kogelbergensis]|uniref:Dolichyl-diphosphooligosaccharide--protein glycosyltransferase subunit OST2 n=1 Tax=Apiospora kogelbergensis TaxID=1337665 RepID=A0AAW0QX43_9PEZI
MAPKKSQTKDASAAAPVVTTGTTASAVPAVSAPSKKPSSAAVAAKSSDAWSSVATNILSHYQKTTPQRTKLIDLFMAFLVVVGGLQFVYCVVAGNYPFNAFLSGFSATVGQFVLTASLRIQTTEANKADFPSVSPERAFADYVVGSLILHFFCVNFIN